jgi:predicted NAD/FAD-binding protein
MRYEIKRRVVPALFHPSADPERASARTKEQQRSLREETLFLGSFYGCFHNRSGSVLKSFLS